VLTKIIAGLLPPDSGTIFLDGKDCTRLPEKLIQGTGVVFQNPDHQLIEQTVFDDVALGLKFRKEPMDRIKEKTRQILQSMDILNLEGQRPFYLSGGQKKRVALAGILITDPPLIILDEPFTGLDWKASVTLIRTLIRLHQDGKTILLVSHELDPILAHITRVIALDKGRITLDAEAEEAWYRLEEFGIRKPHSPDGTRKAITWLR
jgi:biotin transport system ATP-binding protein